MKNDSSHGARLLAALIIVPLIVVAAVIAPTLFGGGALDAEAAVLAATLDRTLARPPAGQLSASVAVLPLKNASGEAALDYLAVGVAADIRDQLARVAGLQLIGQESSENVAGQSLSVRSMARLLGVRHILLGSIRGSAGQLEIELELNVFDQDRQTEWRQTWHSATDSLPTATQAVAARVLQSVLPVQRSDLNLPNRRYTPSGSAFGDYLRGRYLIDRYNAEDVLSGIGFLERAIATDPEYENAYWAKIAAHQRMTWIDARTADDHNALIDATADAYLAFDLESPLTHRLHAMRAAIANRRLDAYAAFQLAVELAPQEYAYDRGYMNDLCAAGYTDRCLEQASGLARREPVSAAAHTGLAHVYRILGDNDRMLEHARLSGRFGGDLARFFEALALIDQGEWQAASTMLAGALDDVGVTSAWVPSWIEAVQDPAAADAAVERMRAVDEASADWLDLFYTEMVAIGRLDLAYGITENLIAEDFQTWDLYIWETGMREFRADPRFLALMADIGLIDVWRVLGLPDVCVNATPESFCASIGVAGSDGDDTIGE